MASALSVEHKHMLTHLVCLDIDQIHMQQEKL